MDKSPRVRIPAQARERIYRQAAAFARSAADTMIAGLERKLSEELAAAMLARQVPRPGSMAGLDAVEDSSLATRGFHGR